MNRTSRRQTITGAISAAAFTLALLLSVPAFAMDGGKLGNRMDEETAGTATTETVVASSDGVLSDASGTSENDGMVSGARMFPDRKRFGTR